MNENWISVKDRLPNGMTNVLLYVSDSVILMGKRVGDGMWAAYWFEGHGPVDLGVYTITHWMPLPKPPKN